MSASVIILGAGRPFRGDEPSALVRTGGDKHVLDWTMEAFRDLGNMEFHFVGGYRLDEIAKRYPTFHFTVNPVWAETKSTGSLFVAPIQSGQETYVCYADVVFRASAVRALAEREGDVIIGVDRLWRDRYDSRSAEDLAAAEKVRIENDRVVAIDSAMSAEEADAEFIGLCRLSPAAVGEVLRLRAALHSKFANQGIPALINALQDAGLRVRPVDVQGDWAELNSPQDLARFVLGTKGETLERLRPLVRRSIVGDQVRFTVGEWAPRRDELLQRIAAKFARRRLIVRSSAIGEDGWKRSNAGCFKSVAGVDSSVPEAVVSAVQEVIDSYGNDDPSHQVFVQEMVTDVVLSGVVLTRTLSHGGPYYVFNYDDGSYGTHAVTSGTFAALATTVVYRGQSSALRARDDRLLPVLKAVEELEGLVGHDSLDIEFAVDRKGGIHVFQVRPIAVRREHFKGSDLKVDAAIRAAVEQYGRLRSMVPPGYSGRRACFGVMPDWNPAEIVGTKPRRLALSLYRYLVTDEVWATQRAEFGYRDVRPAPLIVGFAGHPFVDVAASFSSFIPASVPDALAKRIVDAYVERLLQHPFLHDKVEFEVAITCLTADFEAIARERLSAAGLNDGDIAVLREGLCVVTNHAFERCDVELRKVEQLRERCDSLLSAGLPPAERAHLLLDGCRRNGTLPFAHLARCAFIAMALLRSLVRAGAIDGDELEAFLASLDTVTQQLERDGAKVASGELAWGSFVRRYGHLRPGTYEITTPSYQEDPERYLRPIVRTVSTRSSVQSRTWAPRKSAEVARVLEELGLQVDVGRFEVFLRRAIEGREYAKFLFSRNLSAALDAFAECGEEHGLSREELSHIDVTDLLSLRSGTPLSSINEWLRQRADEGAAWYGICQAIELPPLIVTEEDFYCFQFDEAHPNYVSQRRVVGSVVELAGKDEPPDLEDTIVLIPQADPGFDWLFGHSIKGLITMYGGANSHMTIRAAELGLPAAIGVGERLYDQLRQARIIALDCAARSLRILQ